MNTLQIEKISALFRAFNAATDAEIIMLDLEKKAVQLTPRIFDFIFPGTESVQDASNKTAKIATAFNVMFYAYY